MLSPLKAKINLKICLSNRTYQLYIRLSKTALLLINFRNRQRWNRRMVNATFLGIGRTGRVAYSIYCVYSASETGIAGRAGIARIVAIN